MRSEPLVSIIMPTIAGRDTLRTRAIRSLAAQTYERTQLLVVPAIDGLTIGEMRNEAIRQATGEIIVHADDDDVSHPQRIAEQVALLQASGADVVGYREALFWDTRPGAFAGAWLYRDPLPTHCLGASMCYWRKTWERQPFDHISHGEDYRFASRCKTVGVSAMEDLAGLMVNVPAIDVTRGGLFGGTADTHRRYIPGIPEVAIEKGKACEPRIVCGIHGDRQSGGYDMKGGVWKRAPQWDAHCAERMAL